MTDTPETDAILTIGLVNADKECAPAEFARKLERERNEWRNIAERCIEYVYEEDWDTYACDIIKDYEKLDECWRLRND